MGSAAGEGSEIASQKGASFPACPHGGSGAPSQPPRARSPCSKVGLSEQSSATPHWLQPRPEESCVDFLYITEGSWVEMRSKAYLGASQRGEHVPGGAVLLQNGEICSPFGHAQVHTHTPASPTAHTLQERFPTLHHHAQPGRHSATHCRWWLCLSLTATL